MSERALPLFGLSGSSSQVAQKWRKWKRAFEYYAEGEGLHKGNGISGYFQDIANHNPAKDNQDPYTACIRKLNHHFHAEENIPFERHIFGQMVPNEWEPVDEYLVYLHQQARHCNFNREVN